jgi:hypothetical protein
MTSVPPSRSFAADLGDRPEVVSEVNSYRDVAALDRVWNRLESRRRRSSGPRPWIQAVAAAALLCSGVFVGMEFERNRVGPSPTATVASEVIRTQNAPTGRVTDPRSSRVGPQRAKQIEETNEKRARRSERRVARLLPPDGLTEAPQTEIPAEVQAGIVEVVVDASPARPEWVLLSERGEYAAAFQRLDEAGGFDGVLANGSSEELMALADVARFVGRQGRAIQALRAVTDRFQGDPNAPLAAMIIGNLLSKAGDAQGAAEAYALNRRLSPGGDFAEDALVREFDMAIADGDLARVERLRAQYEAEFPEGRHLSDMRAEEARLLELSESEATESEAGTEISAPVEARSNKVRSDAPTVDDSSASAESGSP